MPRTPLDDVLRYLRRSFAAHAARDLTDGELLERFVSHREEAAVTILVQRHGPMVLSVCRRVLGDSHRAEDAFQATFLVLVRRASSIGRREPLGGWLYAVAQRIALKARAQATARRHRERRFTPMPCAETLDDLTWRELRSVLDEEIGRLPEKYRTPIVLCYLGGKSYDQAAKELGLAKSSLGNRVARGRELLRQQLVRRGITLSAGALATALCEKLAAAPLPALLTIKTVKAAALVATGQAVAAGSISAHVLALAEEALTGMLLAKGKILVMVLALGLALGGAGWAGYKGLAATSPPAPAANAQAPAPKKQAEVPVKTDQPSAVDKYGDPLPEGAVARLGTKRFRHEGETTSLAFTADGKTLMGSTLSGILAWDPATGKERHRLSVDMPHYGMGVAFSQDGNTVAMAEYSPEEDETKVSLWDLRSGKKTRSLSLPKGVDRKAHFNDLCFAPDGRSLALSRTNEGKALVLDLASGKVRATLTSQGAQAFHRLVISPDGNTLAAVVYSLDPNLVHETNGVQVWDISTGNFLRTIHHVAERGFTNDISSIAFSPDGKMLAFGNSTKVFLSDPATGKELTQLERERDLGQPIGLAFTPDGKKLASGWSMGSILVWDVATGKVLQSLTGRVLVGKVSTFTERCYYSGSMALSPGANRIALGTVGNVVQLWELATGKELCTEYQGHDSQINDLALSPDGKTLISGGEFGQIFRWDMASRQRSGRLPDGGRAARALSFSPDGKQLAAIEQRVIRIWGIAAGKEPLAITVPDAMDVTSASFSHDGRDLFTLDTDRQNWSVRHWELATRQQTRQWTIPPRNYPRKLAPQHKWAITLSQDGKTVFTALRAGDIAIYDAVSGRERLLRGHEHDGTHLAPSPDGRMLAAGMERPTSAVRLWEIVTGKPIVLLKGHQGTVSTIAWSPDGRLVASGDQRSDEWQATVTQSIRLWDTAAGKELACFGGFNADVTAMTFSPDSRALVAGLRDSTILIFDVINAVRPLAPVPRPSKNNLESLWTELVDDNAGKAHQALGTLVAAPTESVPFLRGRLKPAPDPDTAKIQRWIADLESDQFAVRQVAAKELEKIGDQVQPSIQKALNGNTTLETRRRLEQILKSLPVNPGQETVRTIRAIMVLERIGSAEAQAVLEALARGAPGARETEEARASLERLGQRTLKMP